MWVLRLMAALLNVSPVDEAEIGTDLRTFGLIRAVFRYPGMNLSVLRRPDAERKPGFVGAVGENKDASEASTTA